MTDLVRESRLGLVVADTAAIWTGTVSSWDSDTMTLTVSTSTGSLVTGMEGLVLVHLGTTLHRVRTVTPGSNTIKVAETATEFTASDALAIYRARLPWPRYQRIVDSVVYKDFDIAFPGTWQAHLPPIARVLSGNDEAVYVAVNESFRVNGGGSAQLDDGTPLSYAWSAGTDGTADTPAAQNTDIEYSSAGFRYLKLTVTDAHGTESERFYPVWVGSTIHTLTSCEARWSLQTGWEVDLELIDAPSTLKYTPAAIVDIDSSKIVFYGFLVQDTRRDNFERSVYRYRLLPALAFSRYLHSYPLIVETITGVSTPDNWAEVYDLTLARAMWFLLYWHSTLPQLVNVAFDVTSERDIAGQEFSAGMIPAQFDALAKSAFWGIWGGRGGSFYIALNPAYRTEAEWDAYSPTELADSALNDEVEIEYPEPQVSEARLAGVFRTAAGEFAPAIARAPSAPEPFGSPVEMTGLAPEDAAELQQWAARHVGLLNNANRYTVQPRTWFEVGSKPLVELTDYEVFLVEEMSLRFDPLALRWDWRVTGRTRGEDADAVAEPLPPAIVIPDPVVPPVTPPYIPPLPEPEPIAPWPTQVYVATQDLGVFYTANFSGPEGSQPTWTAVNEGLPTPLAVSQLAVAPDVPAIYQFVLASDGTTRNVYRRVAGSDWEEVFTPSAPSGNESWIPYWIAIDPETPGVVYVAQVHTYTTFMFFYDIQIYKSTTYGSSGSFSLLYDSGSLAKGGLTNMLAQGDYLYVGYKNGGSPEAAVLYSRDGGSTWGVSDSGSLYASNNFLHQHPLSPEIVYSSIYRSYSYFYQLASDPLAWTRLGANVTDDTLRYTSLYPSLAFDENDALVMRILCPDGTLRYTDDGWATAIALATGLDMSSLVVNPAYPENLILGREGSQLAVGTPHTLLVSSDDAATLSGKGGLDPTNAATTVSIYYDNGGLAQDGIQAVGYA